MSSNPRIRFAIPIVASAAIALALALPALASAAQTLTVQKAGAGTGTVASSPAGIACGATCSAPFNDGATVSLIASTGANTLAVQWSGCDSVNGENKCFVTMSGPRTVKATFNLIQVQLSVSKNGTGTGTVTSSPAGIECGAGCQASFGKGSTVTLSGAPGANTEAVKWTSGCDSVSGEDKCIVAMSGTKAVTATFNLGSQLSVTKSGNGTGTVTSSPAGISCGASCSATFLKASTVTLTGTAGLHTQAVQWSGCDSVNGEHKCVVAMSAAKAVSASFNLEPQWVEYTVTIEKTGTGQGTVSGSPGSINCGALCSAQVLTATTLTLTATAAPGSVFAHWSGGSCTGAAPCAKAIKSSRTVKAVFTAVGNRTLTVTKAGTGAGTVSAKAAGIDCGATCSAQVPASKKVTLTAKPAAGSAFNHWSGACSGATTCKVTMNEARSATATFERVPTASPPPSSCVVPKLAGRSLSQARSALRAAHCKLGKVSKPKAKKGQRLGPLVVKSSSPPPGATLPAGGKVNLKLKKAHKRRHG